MSKKYKIKNKATTKKGIEEEKNTLSKKKAYDLMQQEKRAKKEKEHLKRKIHQKRKKTKKTYQTNTAGRIFAIVMLLLMLCSIIATISYSFR